MHAFLPRALPEALAPLTELALDLRWTWNHALDALWSSMDPEWWERTKNPWAVLQNVSQKRLDELCRDSDFAERLESAVEDNRRYRSEGDANLRQPLDGAATIAFFSMEFGLSEAIPLYAGGLGVLAGDYLKTASDLGVPVTGIGLLYQEGYFRQSIDAGGRQQEVYPYNDPTSLPIQPVFGEGGGWLKIGLDFPGRKLYLRVWQATVGRTRLYLLDSNDLRNGAVDRGITAKLYGGGLEMRLLQEAVLGIGGWTLIEALGLNVEVCHLNEGHAAFVVLERARRFMRRTGTSFWEAWWATRAGNVFTTHTPVGAGVDVFPLSLIYKYARTYLAEFDISLRDLFALGRSNPDNNDEPFNMTYLALRGCAQSNAVSRLHAEVSRRLFNDLYPRWPPEQVPVSHVTNGVHVPSWDSAWADRLWTKACGKARWHGGIEALTQAIAVIDDEALWAFAADRRRDLVHYARDRLAWQLGQRGESQEKVAEAALALDPNTLTLGLARRFAEYKRPNLLLSDPDRLVRLLLDPQRPVQLIIAGKAHPNDEGGKQLIHEWLEFTYRPGLRRRVVFLEDYDVTLAQQLVQGVDVWINTPRRPWEACGTSGMKILVNGGLNLSELDGWWAEAYDAAYGWAIGAGAPDAKADDAVDAETLYSRLEREVVPAFYDRDAGGVPRGWVRRMRASMSQLAPRFSSNRMLLEYVERLYRPAARAFRGRSADGAALARTLRQWQSALAAGWDKIHFGAVTGERDGDRWRISIPIYLGEIALEAVKVEIYAAADGALPSFCLEMICGAPIAGAAHGYIFSAQVPASRPADDYTPRIRAWHAQAFLPAECALLAWQR